MAAQWDHTWSMVSTAAGDSVNASRGGAFVSVFREAFLATEGSLRVHQNAMTSRRTARSRRSTGRNGYILAVQNLNNVRPARARRFKEISHADCRTSVFLRRCEL